MTAGLVSVDEVNANWDYIRSLMKDVNGRIFQQFGYRVMTGPFAGMLVGKYSKWDDGNAGSKLAGSYEFELRGTIEKIKRRKPDTIVNVGSAEGYYAVGFGRIFPEAMVYAMDIDNDSLDQCEHNARINGLRKLTTVIGKPAPQDLQLGEGRHLFFVDCEGDELALLDPELCPLLRESDIVVECHDFFYSEDNAISGKLMERFSNTHEVELITPEIPYPGDYPLPGLPIGTVLLAITEKRPLPTVWLACWTRNLQPLAIASIVRRLRWKQN